MSTKLIDAYLDGTITAPEMQQLNALLLADADARREFAEILNVDSALAAMAAGWTKNEAPVIRQTKWRTASPRWIAARGQCGAAAEWLVVAGFAACLCHRGKSRRCRRNDRWIGAAR
jgi:anti-sigma factor RsiW